MNKALWLAILATAAGTLLMRLLPLLWMRRHLARRDDGAGMEAIPTWLKVLGPTMIAALLGVSLIPANPTLADGVATLSGVTATLFVWQQTRSLGWPVLAGVMMYSLARLLIH